MTTLIQNAAFSIQQCVNGRCNNLAETCKVISEGTVFGGPYIAGLNGEFELSDGCSATCNGCTDDSTPTMPPTSSSSACDKGSLFDWSIVSSQFSVRMMFLGTILALQV